MNVKISNHRRKKLYLFSWKLIMLKLHLLNRHQLSWNQEDLKLAHKKNKMLKKMLERRR